MPVLPRFDVRSLAADAQAFARAFPAVAGKLARAVPDPFTERLVDGCHYLAATVLDKVEDYQLHAHEMLAQHASPWLRRPIPAATVVAFEPLDHAGPVHVPASVRLESVEAEGAVRCTFRPLAPFTLWPYRVAGAELEARPGRSPVVRVRLESTATGSINEAITGGISLFFDGERENALELAHVLTTGLERAEVSAECWSEPVTVSRAQVTRDGLSPHEPIAPDPDGPAPAFGVLTESFVFPDRFRAVTLRGLAACAQAKPTRAVALTFVLREPVSPRAHLDASNVRVHCVPVVNLFEASADPMPLDFERGPVPIRVAGYAPSAAGVYAVREAWATSNGDEPTPLPLPDLRRLSAGKRAPQSPAAFCASLERSGLGEPSTTIAFAPLGPTRTDEAYQTVSLRLLATNLHAAGRLRPGDLSGLATVGGRTVAFRSLVPCSRYLPPPTGAAFALRAVRLGASPGGDRLAALRDALFLAVPSWGDVDRSWLRGIHARLEGLRALEVGMARRQVGAEATQHGYAYRLTVDESAFNGVGDWGLFGAALTEALARSSPIRTFAELTLVGARSGRHAVYTPRAQA